MKTTNRNVRSFTLIELLVAIAIIAIIVGMLLPPVAHWLNRNNINNAVATQAFSSVSMSVVMVIPIGNSYVVYLKQHGSKQLIGLTMPGKVTLNGKTFRVDSANATENAPKGQMSIKFVVDREEVSAEICTNKEFRVLCGWVIMPKETPKPMAEAIPN